MTMSEKPRLARQAMCDRLAMEFQDTWIVNLGVGMPTLCSNYVDPHKHLIFHSENGVIGYGPLAPTGEEDRYLVNAGGQYVTATPGMAIVHHADSFALIRKGMVDVTVMGAYEVAENGDFANWRVPIHKGGGIGGAMDLAACAKRVFIAMEHTTREGQPRLRKRCTLPITAPGVVKLVVTDLGLFAVTPQGLTLREYAPGWTPEEIQEHTEARLIIADDLRAFRFRDQP
jgi:3-oxoacid CoA-transferase B subunit